MDRCPHIETDRLFRAPRRAAFFRNRPANAPLEGADFRAEDRRDERPALFDFGHESCVFNILHVRFRQFRRFRHPLRLRRAEDGRPVHASPASRFILQNKQSTCAPAIRKDIFDFSRARGRMGQGPRAEPPAGLRPSRSSAREAVGRGTPPPQCSALSARRLRIRREIRIVGHEFRKHAVRPAEPDLQRVFAASAANRVRVGRSFDVVFLDQRAHRGVATQVRADPARGDLASEFRLAIGAQALNREILQRRPAVRPVPLLTALRQRRPQAAWREQLPPNGRSRRAASSGVATPKASG